MIIRSADAEHGRRYGYSAHGGYVDGGRFRDACRDKLFAAIADAHGLTTEQVRNTRVPRDWRIVLIASLPFVAFYYLGSVVLCRIWTTRFSPDEQRLRFAAFAMTSIVASVAGVQLATMWFNIAEMIRIGNDHLGQRGRPPSSPYLIAMFFTGLILFWFAALRQYRSSPIQLPADEHALRLN